MNIDKYIICKGIPENSLYKTVQELANLYADTGFTKEINIFKTKSNSIEYILNFSKETDFERFKYFVNYLFFPIENDSINEVFGYWTLSEKDDINKELYGKRIQLYISEKDEDGDNVYGIPENWTESIKLGFAHGEEYIPKGYKEFDFFEKKQKRSEFYQINSIYGIENKSELKKGCSLFLMLVLLISFLSIFII